MTVSKELETTRKEVAVAEFKILITRVFLERRVKQDSRYSNRNRTGKGRRRKERGILMGQKEINEDGIWKKGGKEINIGTLDFPLALRLASY
jgi:hypothetical protein